MAASGKHHILFDLIAVLLINGALCAITTPPNNTLVVRCRDDSAYMTCVSDADNEVAWTYDGNTVINAPCTANTDVFVAEPKSPNECNIRALLANAPKDPDIGSISGPYGCTDLSSSGVTDTSIVIVLDGWCGLLSNCPVYEGQDVEIGCYVQYDWQSYMLLYNPIVSVNSSAEFVGVPGTLTFFTPAVLSPPGPPASEILKTNHTIRNVQSGQTISQTCRVTFDIDRGTGYSGRNRHATNSLEWICMVQTPIIYCPRNVKIIESDGHLRCSSDSASVSYRWTDNLSGQVTYGETYPLPDGEYNVTCTAVNGVNCTSGHPACEGSIAASDPDFPYNKFGRMKPSSTVPCNDISVTVVGHPLLPTTTPGSVILDTLANPYAVIGLAVFGLIAIVVIILLTLQALK